MDPDENAELFTWTLKNFKTQLSDNKSKKNYETQSVVLAPNNSTEDGLEDTP